MSDTQQKYCSSCGSAEYMRNGKCYSAECLAYLAEPPAIPLEERTPKQFAMPGYEDHDDEAEDPEDACAEWTLGANYCGNCGTKLNIGKVCHE